MQIINTANSMNKPKLFILVYGNGGVGKTTFASTAPNVLMADCEGGAKYLGMRGISMDVAHITKWADMKDFLTAAKTDKYETIVIDPLNELMEKLMNYLKELNDAKLIQKDGSPTMAGWGWLKTNLRNYLKVLRDIGKHLILITHVAEDKDEDKLLKRPMLMTKLAQEVVNMVDIVAYMTMIQADDGNSKRVLYVHPESDKYVAKDRTGALDKYNRPDFNHLYELVIKNFDAKLRPADSQATNDKVVKKTTDQPTSKVKANKKKDDPPTTNDFDALLRQIASSDEKDVINVASEIIEKIEWLSDDQRSTIVSKFIL